jgi:predicted enzyme related to lactoylglutathione lyase
MPDDADRGRFVWYELLTSDPDAAKGFYMELIGWGTTQWEGGKEPYTMWTKGEAPVAGVMILPEDAVKAGVPPHWLAYIGTPRGEGVG